jgi:hypothetical protein
VHASGIVYIVDDNQGESDRSSRAGGSPPYGAQMGDSPAASAPDPDRIEESSNEPGERPRNSWIAPGSSDVVDAAGESSDNEDSHRGRRILSRIPGLSRLSEQSGWAEDDRESGGGAPAEDPGWVLHEGDGDAFAGWLYHYADGTMVDAEGVEYALPEPEVGPGTEPEAGPGAEPEAGPEPEAVPEPRLSVVAPPPAEPEPREPPQLAVVETPPDESVAEPEPEAEPELEPEPEPEPEPQPEPGPEPSDKAPAQKPVEAERPSDIPRFVEYSPTHVRGYLLGGVFVAASVAAVLTLFVAISDSSAPALVIAGGCMLLALVSWWALLGWKPTVVTIEEGVLDVSRGGHSERFELTDPATVVDFAGRPGSPTWTATVRNNNGPRTVLRPSQVKPRQFERIVRHHRAPAETARSDDTAPG